MLADDGAIDPGRSESQHRIVAAQREQVAVQRISRCVALALAEIEDNAAERLLVGRIGEVIMVTAYGDDERRCVAEELGAAECITKPVDFDLLKAQLRQLQTTA